MKATRRSKVGRPRAPGATSAVRFLAHLVEQLAGRRRIERVEAHVAAAHQFERHGRREEADRRADAGIGRHDHALDADLLGHARGVQRRAATEGDQRVLVRRRRRARPHARARHSPCSQTPSRRRRRRAISVDRPMPSATSRSTAPRAASTSSGDRAAGEMRRIDLAQHDIGVGHGGMPAAAAVAGRAGLGAGALGPDRDALQRIERGDRAAAGADLDHLDHRDAHRQAAALQEAGGAVDLESARGVRLAVVDQADLGRGAAHVEGERRASRRARAAIPRREDRAAGRAGFDQPDRKAPRRLDGGEPAARGHQVDRAA